MTEITPIRPGLKNPISYVKTKSSKHGFVVSQEINGEINIVLLNYIEAVKVMDDISEWLYLDQAD